MFVDDLFNKKTLTENSGGGSPWHSEPEQQQMDANRRGGLERERNAGLDEPDDAPSDSAPTGNGVYEYIVPAGQESVAQELGLQQHKGHWVSRVPIQRANFQFGRPQFHEIPSQGVAEGLNEMDKSAPQPGRDGKVSHSTYGSRDKKGSDYFKGKEAPGKPITKKQMEKHALDILKKQGVAEGMLDNPGAQNSPVASAIVRRILMQRTDLLSKYGPEKVGAAVDEVADFVGDVDEIGSSDVSGWIRHVEQMLGNMGEDVAEGKQIWDGTDWGPQGRFAGDTHVDVGGATMKMIQVGDIVKYLGQKAEVVALSKDRKRARIRIKQGMGGITQDVNTSDLKQLGQGVAEGAQVNEVFNIVPNLAQQIEKKENELKVLKDKMAARTTTNAGIQTGATALIDPDTQRPYEKDKLAAMYGYKEPEAAAADDAQADETPPAPVAQTPAQIRAAKQKAAAATAQGQMAGAAPAPVAQTPAATTPTPTPTNPVGFNASNVMKLPGMEKYAKPAAPAKTANFAGPSGYGKTTTSIKPPAAPSSPALAVPKVPAAPTAPKVTAGGPTPAEKAKLDKRIAAAAAAPAVAETLAQVDRMLESVTSKKSADMIRAYVDQRFTELGLRNTTECRHLMAHVVQESAIRRRQYAKSLAN